MSHGAPVLRALLLVLLGMALVSPGAVANSVPPKYKLVYGGSGSYGVDLVSPEGQRGHVAADFHWRIAYQAVPVRHGVIEWRKGAASGSGQWSMASEADSCSRAGGLQLKGDGAGLLDFQGRVLEVIAFPEEGDFSSADPAGAGGPCDTTDFWSQWVTGFSQIGASEGVDPLTSYFKVPKGKLRQRGGIKVQTSNRTPTFPSLSPSSSCGFNQTGECTQNFSWHATVTIKRAR
jgi:hypothetical protein